MSLHVYRTNACRKTQFGYRARRLDLPTVGITVCLAFLAMWLTARATKKRVQVRATQRREEKCCAPNVPTVRDGLPATPDEECEHSSKLRCRLSDPRFFSTWRYQHQNHILVSPLQPPKRRM